MAEYVIPNKNWHARLADTIRIAHDGDTIVVKTDAQAELASRALARISPGKNIKIVVYSYRILGTKVVAESVE